MKLSAIHKFADATSYYFTFPTTDAYNSIISHIDEFYDVLGMDACERIVLSASRMEAYRHTLTIPNAELV